MPSEAPSEWRTVRLGELVSIEHGYAFKSEFFCEPGDGTPIVVGVGNFRYTGGFRFETTSLKGYSGGFPERFRLRPGDILLVMTCQTQGGEILGVPGRIPADGRVYLHNQRLGRAVFRDTARIDPDFAYWLFLDPKFNRELHRTASGSKILHTAPERIEAYVFALPPLPEQRRIARVLRSLDDKIDSNARLETALEAIVAAMFRARFLDQVPGAADQASRASRRVGSLNDLAGVTRGSVQPSTRPEAIFEHFSIPAFDSGGAPEEVLGARILSAKTRIPDSDVVLLSKLNPRMKRVWWPRPSGAGTPVCSPEFLVLVPHAGIPTTYLYAVVSFDERFYGELLSHVAGTTGSRQRVKPQDALGCAAIVPSPDELQAWEAVARPLLDLAHGAHAENSKLARTKDELLPRLVCGAIRIADTSDVEEATGIAAQEAAA